MAEIIDEPFEELRTELRQTAEMLQDASQHLDEMYRRALAKKWKAQAEKALQLTRKQG